MKRQVLVIFFIVLFQHIAVSQKCDSITIKVNKNVSFNRYKDSVFNDFLTGYLIGDSIQKITERIELPTVEIQFTYIFHHGILAGVDHIVTDKPEDKDDSLMNSLIPAQNYSSYNIPGDKFFKYSKEDDSLLRNSKVFINRKR